MAIVALLATAITTTGLPVTLIGWEILAITAAGTTIIYLAKNYVFPSISVLGTVDLRDLLSGGLIAVGSALSSFAASAITSTAINWNNVIHLVVITVIGYFAKQFATPAVAK